LSEFAGLKQCFGNVLSIDLLELAAIRKEELLNYSVAASSTVSSWKVIQLLLAECEGAGAK
jgi:hypothetical protein